MDGEPNESYLIGDLGLKGPDGKAQLMCSFTQARIGYLCHPRVVRS